MAKRPETRLGYYGIHEIKKHPWFDTLDFGLLEAGYKIPPFKPKLEEIHTPMSGTEAPPQDRQFMDVRLTNQFEASLSGFPFVSKKSLQEEMVEVLRAYDSEKMKRRNEEAAAAAAGHNSGHGGGLGLGFGGKYGKHSKHGSHPLLGSQGVMDMADYDAAVRGKRDASCLSGCTVS